MGRRSDRHLVRSSDVINGVARKLDAMRVHPDDRRRVLEIVQNTCEELELLNGARRDLEKGDTVIGTRPRLARWQKDLMETGYTPF